MVINSTEANKHAMMRKEELDFCMVSWNLISTGSCVSRLFRV